MTRKDWLWHLFAWALGALCLWVDVRLFAIYAFASISIVSRQVDDARRQIDHVRALVRVLSVAHDAKLIAIYRQLGLTEAEIRTACTDALAVLTPIQIQTLEEDYARVCNPAPEIR